MTNTIGLIAEDDTDIETFKVIINRILGRPTGYRKRAGNGCAKVRHKAGIWLRQLGSEGCSTVIVVHDLDRNPNNNALNDISQLHKILDKTCAEAKVSYFICIPVEELEAWFWSDDNVVKTVGRGKGKAHPNPEKIIRPKEALARLSKGANKKPLYSTNDNPSLARELSIDACREKCQSFSRLYEFIRQL